MERPYIYPYLLVVIIALQACDIFKPAPPPPEPTPDVRVDPRLAMDPPLAQQVELRIDENHPNGNLFIQASFAPGAIQDLFHAVEVGDTTVVLRDDGLGGDLVKGDGIFTAALREPLADVSKSLVQAFDPSTQKALLDAPVFKGRELIPPPETWIDPIKFDPHSLLKGSLIKLPGIALCEPPRDVSIPHSIMVTATSVVEDPARTSQPCVRPSATGAWTFGKLMTDMANTPVSGVSPEDFIRHWLQHWLEPHTINGELVPARPRILDHVIRPWLVASGATSSVTLANWRTFPIDLAKAPFKLTAIVNRLDLRGNVGYGISNAGEGRFVFEVLNTDCLPLRTPQEFTVILEYGIPITNCTALRAYAKKWYDLRLHTLGSPAYNAALEAVTNVFALANAAPDKPNGSAINQIRTNEFALNVSPWELREFGIDATSRMLVQTTVVDEPAKRFNAAAVPPGAPADVTTMANWVNTVFSTDPVVPLDISGTPFRGGRSHTEFGGIWNAAPGQITDPENRHTFSLRTCSGCHGGETNTTFLHVGRASFGSEAPLSGFLTGITVTDPVSGSPRSFNDLVRRRDDLARLQCICTGKRWVDLHHVLTFKPIHMTH